MSKARDIASNGGLVKINNLSFNNVTTAVVDNVFSPTYRNYKITVTGTAGVNTPTRFLYRNINSSGSIISSAGNYITGFQWWRQNTSSTGVEGGVNSTACVLGVANSYGFSAEFDVQNYNSEPIIQGKFSSYTWANDFSCYSTTVGHRGFALITDGAGLFNLEVVVYGYRN